MEGVWVWVWMKIAKVENKEEGMLRVTVTGRYP